MTPLRERYGRQPHEYRVSIMCGLIAAITVAIGVTMLPIESAVTKVNWRLLDSVDPVTFEMIKERQEKPAKVLDEPGALIPITTIEQSQAEESEVPVSRLEPIPVGTDETDKEEGTDTPEENSLLAASRLDQLDVLDFAEQSPTLIGGMGGLYLRIRYPDEAKKRGIQGRVILSFIVEKDGSVSDVKTLKSLHKLCDEAAMEAVSTATFTPARQNGETVRVKMNLPIRFVLLDVPEVEKSDSIG